MINLAAGETLYSFKTDDGTDLYLTATSNNAFATLTSEAPSGDYAQSWLIDNDGQLYAQSGIYLDNNTTGDLVCTSSEPTTIRQWVFTEVNSEECTLALVDIENDNRVIGYLAPSNDKVKVKSNSQKWKFSKSLSLTI